MTDKQREAVKIVLQQCAGGYLEADKALAVIDSIIDSYQPAPWPIEPDISPWWPSITYVDISEIKSTTT